MTRYKHAGIFTKCRTFKRWILVIDGEEIKFNQRKLAFLCAEASIQNRQKTQLFEETIMRFISPADIHGQEKSFRIDITYKLNYPNI